MVLSFPLSHWLQKLFDAVLLKLGHIRVGSEQPYPVFRGVRSFSAAAAKQS
jgi:hypothetical protein